MLAETRSDRLPTLEASRGAAVAVAVGLVLGVVTQLGQSLLPEGFGQLANSISPWLSVAFVVGALQSSPRLAVVAGFLTLALALVGYYATIFIRFGYTGGGSSLIFWTMGSIAGGLVFGPAGWFWRNGTFTAGIIAVALLGSAWMAEAAYLAMVLLMAVVAIGYALIGLTVPLLLGRTLRGRLFAFAAMLPAVALGGVGFVAFIKFYELLSGV
ncbi:MAG: DUF6518 family protein [Chloroflexota bacterium]